MIVVKKSDQVVFSEVFNKHENKTKLQPLECLFHNSYQSDVKVSFFTNLDEAERITVSCFNYRVFISFSCHRVKDGILEGQGHWEGAPLLTS